MSSEHETRGSFAEAPYFARTAELDESQAISSINFAQGDLSIARYRRRRPGLGITDPNPILPMFMAVVTLEPLPKHGGWRNGRSADVPELGTGALACLDLRESWISDIPHPFHTFHTFIPMTAFDEFSEESRISKIECLSCPNTTETRDEAMLGLARALLPLLERPNEVNALFADHIFAAQVAHLALTYGGTRNENIRRHPPFRTLTHLQQRRVTEFLRDDLKANASLTDLASLCGLSRSHFAAAFKQTLGMPSHRWLMMQRLSRAKELLCKTKAPISQIAAECGFADQAHLTRVFKKAFGVGPAGWRRDRQD
jgi:AraC family transcriptional regulator